MKSLYFDEFYLEVSEHDALKLRYEAFSESGEGDDMEIYESKFGKLNLQPGDEKEIAVALEDLKKGKLKDSRLELLGDRLYRILFPEEIHKRFEQALNNIASHSDERGLRIIIAYPEDSKVAKWPLEILHCPDLDIWLATDKHLSLSRRLIPSTFRPSKKKQPPLRILVVVSSPKKKAAVMSTKILENLIDWARSSEAKRSTEQPSPLFRRMETQEEAEESAPIQVQVLGQIPEFEPKEDETKSIFCNCPAGYQEFVKKVEEWKPQVLHFIGHGDVKDGQGRLAFVNPLTQLAEWVTAKQFSQFVTPSSSLRLVVLQVCKSADPDVQLNLASTMVNLNIPAVVAMQFEIDNYCGVEFANCFYQALAQRKHVDHAVQLARFHITQVADPVTKRPLFWSNREFSTPVVFSIKPGTIIDTRPANALVPESPVAMWPSSQEMANILTALPPDQRQHVVKMIQSELAGSSQMTQPGPQRTPSTAFKESGKVKGSKLGPKPH